MLDGIWSFVLPLSVDPDPEQTLTLIELWKAFSPLVVAIFTAIGTYTITVATRPQRNDRLDNQYQKVLAPLHRLLHFGSEHGVIHRENEIEAILVENYHLIPQSIIEDWSRRSEDRDFVDAIDNCFRYAASRLGYMRLNRKVIVKYKSKKDRQNAKKNKAENAVYRKQYKAAKAAYRKDKKEMRKARDTLAEKASIVGSVIGALSALIASVVTLVSLNSTVQIALVDWIREMASRITDMARRIAEGIWQTRGIPMAAIGLVLAGACSCATAISLIYKVRNRK